MSPLSRLLFGLARSRWVIRLNYVFRRWPNATRLLRVRYLRRWAIVLYHRHRDSAPSTSMITLRLTNSCNLRCVQCAQWGENGVFKREATATNGRNLTTEEWMSFIRRMSSSCPHIYFFG